MTDKSWDNNGEINSKERRRESPGKQARVTGKLTKGEKPKGESERVESNCL
jgi:hypothetical protein